MFDPTTLYIDPNQFPKQDWSSTVYAVDGELEEKIPNNLPTPHRKGFVMQVFVDSDHVGDLVTRRSRMGYLVYLQNALIYYSSKKQTGVVTSLFGSEFMAIKHATEYVRGL